MDLRLPDLSGIDVMLAIRAEFPDARIVLLTMFAGDVEIQRALQAGAQGYLLKSMPPEQMVETIRQVHAGKKRVPPEIASHSGRACRRANRSRIVRSTFLRHVSRWKSESRYREEAVHLRRNGQGSPQAHHGEAGRERSDACHGDRGAPGIHSAVEEAGKSRLLPVAVAKREPMRGRPGCEMRVGWLPVKGATTT